LESLRRGEGGGDLSVVSTGDLLEVGVETGDVPGSGLDQFTAVVDQTTQVLYGTVETRRWQIVVTGTDPGDQKSVRGV